MTRLRAGRAGATAAVLAAAVLAMAFGWGPLTTAPTARGAVTLVYVGAEDCAPCRSWQNVDGAKFRASPEFAPIIYREVKSPTARDLLNDDYWPDDLRGHRDRLGRGAGVPLWLVIADDEIIERAFGASQWHSTVLPKIKSLLR